LPRIGGGARSGGRRKAVRPARSAQRTSPSVVTGPWGGPPTNAADQHELDALLDKISAQGIDSLSKGEKQRLNELSKRLRER
jgi:hypothetical protein